MPVNVSKNTPLCLCILDGFGYSPLTEGNSIASTPTPTLDYLWSHYPHTLIKAAEEEVGLDFGQPGNSEVGHLSIGTGRVLLQHLPRINLSIHEKSFFQNPAFFKAVNHIRTTKGRLHIMGMVSTPGVHAHLDHFLALMDFAKSQGITSLFLHPILDGRDTGAYDSPLFIQKIEERAKKLALGKIASLGGRESAMDRNENWDKTENYYNMILGLSTGEHPEPPLKIIEYFHQQKIDDEHIPPTLLDKQGIFAEGDAVIFTNYREDRARQITKALAQPQFMGFPRKKVLSNFILVTMTQYEQNLPVEVAYPPESTLNCLADCLEGANLSQFHVAETEKTAHVSYFFNGGRELALPHEEHFTVKSLPPESFLAHPEMSAAGVTTRALEAIKQDQFDAYIINYANADMIGHTGDFNATCAAVACLDQEVNRLVNAILRKNGTFVMTADHGNAEQKIDPKTGQIYKEHTINPVPFIMANFLWHKAGPTSQKIGSAATVTGILADVAPTILRAVKIPQPSEMTGTSLFNL